MDNILIIALSTRLMLDQRGPDYWGCTDWSLELALPC